MLTCWVTLWFLSFISPPQSIVDPGEGLYKTIETLSNVLKFHFVTQVASNVLEFHLMFLCVLENYFHFLNAVLCVYAYVHMCICLNKCTDVRMYVRMSACL